MRPVLAAAVPLPASDTAYSVTDPGVAYLTVRPRSKTFALPTVPALFTTQGTAQFGRFAFTLAALIGGTLEQLLAELPANLTQGRRASPPFMGGGQPQVCYLFGWHSTRGAFTAWNLDGMDPDGDFLLSEAASFLRSPRDDQFPDPSWCPDGAPPAHEPHHSNGGKRYSGYRSPRHGTRLSHGTAGPMHTGP